MNGEWHVGVARERQCHMLDPSGQYVEECKQFRPDLRVLP